MYATSTLDNGTLDNGTLDNGADTDTSFDATFDATINATINATFDEIVAPVARPTGRARCADGHGTLTHLFFSEVPLDTARAKAICSKCALATGCLEAAIERIEPWGVWGGELIDNGRIVLSKRPRGRPPKHARPATVVDEVPIPPHLLDSRQVGGSPAEDTRVA